ncbi:MAG: TRAP transporter small permease [Pseudomonadota bacterium]|nr:TRAP transporter small permease [Pseudomonadota bacterium]
MRKFLDRLYLTAGVLAGVCIALITLIILTQIVARWFGVIIPSTEDFSGFLLASASFLALAYTFRGGGHIRVSLLIHRMHGAARRGFELFALAVITAMIGYFAWHLVLLVIESWHFGELSQGYIAVPIWIPQAPMGLGLVIFFIALVDDLIQLLQGGTPDYLKHESLSTGSNK